MTYILANGVKLFRLTVARVPVEVEVFSFVGPVISQEIVEGSRHAPYETRHQSQDFPIPVR